MTQALIVGQAPSRTSREPIDGRSRRRLEQLAGLDEDELPYWFALGNLLPAWPGNRERRPGPHSAPGDLFDLEAARRSWRSLAGAELAAGEFDLVLLLGRNVAAAAGLGPRWFVWYPLYPTPEPRWGYCDREPALDPWAACSVAVVPHPSGASHFWNDAGRRGEAARFMRRLVGWLA